MKTQIYCFEILNGIDCIKIDAENVEPLFMIKFVETSLHTMQNVECPMCLQTVIEAATLELKGLEIFP